MAESESGPAATASRSKAGDPNVFISWSGERSEVAANALASWLPTVIQSVKPFVSSSMPAGVVAVIEMFRALQTCDFGIICVTKESQDRPWLNFEAGALALHVPELNRVVPYLLDDMVETDLKEPLAAFQAKRANKSGTRELLSSINESVWGGQLPKERLSAIFEHFWDELNDELQALGDAEPSAPSPRTEKDMLEELVLSVRELSRRIPTAESSLLQDLLANVSVVPKTASVNVDAFPPGDFAGAVVNVRDLRARRQWPAISTLKTPIQQILGYDRVQTLGYDNQGSLLIELASEPTDEDRERVKGMEELQSLVPRITLTGPPLEEDPSSK